MEDNDEKAPEAKRIFRIVPRPDGASLTGNENMVIQLMYIPLRRDQIHKLGLLVLSNEISPASATRKKNGKEMARSDRFHT